MKKNLFLILLILIMPVFILCGCGEIPKSEDYASEGNTRFVYVKEYTVDNDTRFKILVDKETKVMYLYYSSMGSSRGYAGLTVMLNADGTPMLWEGELEWSLIGLKCQMNIH